ncbi:GATA transcription factor 9-like [Musa acuminata AAA Group]|uniref:GATA transcription factor 9-like n=1 Tax=Musa acuminata AAA Group TaxID=214697 RepID=UPI0031D2C2D3
MEAADHFHGGFCRAGNPHCSPEKKAGGGGGGGAGDPFVVEDLLDFSNEEEEEDKAEVLAGGREDDGAAGGNSTDSSTVTSVDSCSNSLFGLEPYFSGDLVCRSFADAGLSGDLCQPLYDELAELEWLSNFVEESSSEDLHKLHLVSGVIPTASSCTTGAANRAEVSHDGGRADQVAHFRTEAPVPGKARSKRSRSAPCSWSSRLLVLSSSPESEFVGSPCGGGGKKAAKKKDPPADPGMAVTDGRKCLHCQTDKTPQWRTGPMGPKTLCNACGVRYKSGRLVPEYRPAASPTFVVSKHSNSHRKVIELRRQKILRHQLHQSAAPFDGPSNFLIPGPNIRHLI